MFDFAHLAPLEAAARLFCTSQDQDPDEQMEVPHPMGLAGVKFSRPAWHFPAENMLNLSLMLACMRRYPAAAPEEKDDRQLELFPRSH